MISHEKPGSRVKLAVEKLTNGALAQEPRARDVAGRSLSLRSVSGGCSALTECGSREALHEGGLCGGVWSRGQGCGHRAFNLKHLSPLAWAVRPLLPRAAEPRLWAHVLVLSLNPASRVPGLNCEQRPPMTCSPGRLHVRAGAIGGSGGPQRAWGRIRSGGCRPV